ncbi:MAG: hypothetical protein WKF88_07115 [Ferruginibacter sp.]
MKKFIIILLLLSMIKNNVAAQDVNNPDKPITSQDYLKKARAQKTAGFIFLGVAAGSIAIVAPGNTSMGTAGILGGLGVASLITSVAQFIASGNNKRKAQLMPTTQKTAYFRNGREKNVTGISLKIPLGK